MLLSIVSRILGSGHEDHTVTICILSITGFVFLKGYSYGMRNCVTLYSQIVISDIYSKLEMTYTFYGRDLGL